MCLFIPIEKYTVLYKRPKMSLHQLYVCVDLLNIFQCFSVLIVIQDFKCYKSIMSADYTEKVSLQHLIKPN